MLLIYYPPCSTCHRAKSWLDEHGYTYEERNIREDAPTYEELKAWHQKSGVPIRSFFNSSGLLYREFGLKELLDTMDDEAQLRMLSSNGMLVKRPVLIAGERVLLGFREAEWETLGK